VTHLDGGPDPRGITHARNLGALIARGIYRLSVRGLSHVPTRGPVVLAANHMGLIDGPLLVATAPRPVHTLAKFELFDGALGSALRWAGQIRVEYEQADRTALHQAAAVLARGDAVGLFPEGHRGRGDARALRRGVGYLLAHAPADTPVVPVAILGTRHTGRPKGWIPPVGSRLHVVFGEAFLPAHAGTAQFSHVAAITDHVQRVLALHVAEAVQRTGRVLPADDVSVDEQGRMPE
jgi:1-acyl-sn-glycerol-3-phosphate acyltransferase